MYIPHPKISRELVLELNRIKSEKGCDTQKKTRLKRKNEHVYKKKRDRERPFNLKGEGGGI